MATAQVTVTAKTGPANQVTSQVFTRLSSITIDIARQVISLNREGELEEFDLTGVTTITDTITATNHVLVIS